MSEPTETSQKSLRAPDCYGERPTRGSEQRSVLGIRREVEVAGQSETAFQLGPTPTRGTGPAVQERIGALVARHSTQEQSW